MTKTYVVKICIVNQVAGLYIGSEASPYKSNIPPLNIFVKELEKMGRNDIANIIRQHL